MRSGCLCFLQDSFPPSEELLSWSCVCTQGNWWQERLLVQAAWRAWPLPRQIHVQGSMFLTWTAPFAQPCCCWGWDYSLNCTGTFQNVLKCRCRAEFPLELPPEICIAAGPTLLQEELLVFSTHQMLGQQSRARVCWPVWSDRGIWNSIFSLHQEKIPQRNEVIQSEQHLPTF